MATNENPLGLSDVKITEEDLRIWNHYETEEALNKLGLSREERDFYKEVIENPEIEEIVSLKDTSTNGNS